MRTETLHFLTDSGIMLVNLRMILSHSWKKRWIEEWTVHEQSLTGSFDVEFRLFDQSCFLAFFIHCCATL